MDSFAKYQTDGESGERMYAMLKDRAEPKSWWETPYPPTAEDVAYTNAIFHTIDGFTENRLRRFCLGFGDYNLFRKNLQQWKKLCGYRA